MVKIAMPRIDALLTAMLSNRADAVSLADGDIAHQTLGEPPPPPGESGKLVGGGRRRHNNFVTSSPIKQKPQKPHHKYLV